MSASNQIPPGHTLLELAGTIVDPPPDSPNPNEPVYFWWIPQRQGSWSDEFVRFKRSAELYCRKGLDGNTLLYYPGYLIKFGKGIVPGQEQWEGTCLISHVNPGKAEVLMERLYVFALMQKFQIFGLELDARDKCIEDAGKKFNSDEGCNADWARLWNYYWDFYNIEQHYKPQSQSRFLPMRVYVTHLEREVEGYEDRSHLFIGDNKKYNVIVFEDCPELVPSLSDIPLSASHSPSPTPPPGGTYALPVPPPGDPNRLDDQIPGVGSEIVIRRNDDSPPSV